MRSLYKYLMLSALLLTVASCVYDFDPQIEGTGGLLVIEGDVLAGDTTLVQVSTVSALSAEPVVEPVRSAVVYVESEDGTMYYAMEYNRSYLLDEPHYCIDTRMLDVNRRCRLVVRVQAGIEWVGWSPVITYNDYFSDWVEVQKSASALDSIGFYVTDDLSRLDVNIWMHGGTETGYYRWVGRSVWEYTAEYQASVYYNPSDNSIIPYEGDENYFYCWKRQAPREIMIASTKGLSEDKLTAYTVFSTEDKSDERFSQVYSLTLLQERLSPEAYAYWLATERNTFNTGGLMSPQPSEIQGNIHSASNPDEKVIGYINASTVTRAHKYYRHTVGKFYYSPGNRTEPVVLLAKDWSNYYHNRNYRPLWEHIPPEIEGVVPPVQYEWAPRYCSDCRMRGGSKTRPADWPTNHK